MKIKIYCFVAALLLVAACYFPSTKQTLRLAWAGPTFPSGFTCVGVVVTGEGIPSSDATLSSDWQSIYAGSACPYPGISTSLKEAKVGSTVEFELKVPSGNNRTVQVMGIATTDKTCPQSTVSDLIVAQHNGKLDGNITAFYELGRGYTATQKTTLLPVKNTYDPETSKNLLECSATSGGGGGSGLTLPYKTLTLFQGDKIILSASGGKPPYAFSATFGTVNGASYEAPIVTGTGVLSVTDQSGGAPVTTTIQILDPSGFGAAGGLKYWFSARILGGSLNNGDPIPNAQSWGNLGTAAGTIPIHSLGTNGASYYLEGVGPKGTPVAQIEATSKFEANAGTVDAPFAMFAVVRRLAPTLANVFCFSTGSDCSSDTTAAYLGFTSVSTATMSLTVRSSPSSYGAASSDSNSGVTDWALLQGSMTFAPGQLDTAYNMVAGTTGSHGFGTFSTGGRTYIGTTNSANGASVKMQIAEILVYEGTADAASIAAQINAKYGF